MKILAILKISYKNVSPNPPSSDYAPVKCQDGQSGFILCIYLLLRRFHVNTGWLSRSRFWTNNNIKSTKTSKLSSKNLNRALRKNNWFLIFLSFWKQSLYKTSTRFEIFLLFCFSIIMDNFQMTFETTFILTLSIEMWKRWV